MEVLQMAVMYCPKCIVEVMDLINHEEGTDFEILNEGTENEIREEFAYVVDTYKCPMCGHEVEDYMEDEE
jgi:rubredoxin